jgi:hypothetical protein
MQLQLGPEVLRKVFLVFISAASRCVNCLVHQVVVFNELHELVNLGCLEAFQVDLVTIF